MKNAILSFALFCALLPLSAQTTLLVPTTLSSAVTNPAARTIVVASATGIVAGSVLRIEHESLVATAAPTGTTVPVRRGADGTVGTAHPSGAIVFFGSAAAFAAGPTIRLDHLGRPAGGCTRANIAYLPYLDARSNSVNDCLGGTWQTGNAGPGAASIAGFHILSPNPGSAALTGINTNGTAVGATTLYCTEVFLPANKLLTGIGVLNGTTVTANARYVILYDSAGNPLINSALAGQASVTASVYENYAFTARYFALGPQQYFACLQDNATGSTTVRMVVTSLGDHVLTKGQTGATFGTVPTLTVPTTFTTAVGPWVYLY